MQANLTSKILVANSVVRQSPNHLINQQRGDETKPDDDMMRTGM